MKLEEEGSSAGIIFGLNKFELDSLKKISKWKEENIQLDFQMMVIGY